jgi:hypothetical protein
MKSPKNIQINFTIPDSWRKERDNLARIYSVEEETNLTYVDLIRGAIHEKYELSEGKVSRRRKDD